MQSPQVTQQPNTPTGADLPPNGSDTAGLAETPEHASSHESGSPKRRQSASAKASDKRKKRRKVNHACVYCQRSHMTCDQQRPCGRCIKRSIGHLCHDEPRESHRRSRADAGIHPHQPGDTNIQEDAGNTRLTAQPPQLPQPDTSLNLASAPIPAPASNSASHIPVNNTSDAFPPLSHPFYGYNDWPSGPQDSLADMHFHPNSMFNTSELSNEYSLLNDFLNNSILEDALDDTVYGGEAGQLKQHQQQQTLAIFPEALSSQAAPSTSAPNGMFAVSPGPGSTSQTPQPPSVSLSKSAANAANEKAREKYFMTAADPAGTDTPEERMNRLLQAKYDAGLLKPYNYPKGYQKLQDWMAKNVQPASKERIVYQFNKFRPKFRQRIQKLTDIELILVEMWFERRLMEYDRIFASMAIPACCWRRTGEIFRGNREMSELIRVPQEQLRDGKLALYDILTEDSLVGYWEKFTDIAFDESQKAILTSCSLKPPSSEPPGQMVRCCFSFTVNRDSHGVPTLIVGNFLPVTPPNP